MTGCDIVVERRRLGLLGPLTHFRYLTWHFSKVVKIATPLPITGRIKKKEKEKRKTLMDALISFQSSPMLPSVLNISAVSPVSKISLLLHVERQKGIEERQSGKKRKEDPEIKGEICNFCATNINKYCLTHFLNLSAW